MRRALAVVLVLVGFGGFLASQSMEASESRGPHADLLVIDGTIDSVSADFLSRGLDVAVEDGASLLIVQLDTPGGLLSSTRNMVETILASPIPVVVYVAPAGARAASAGTFIVAASHLAAMAPGANIGAASPVGAAGKDLPETLKSKATQDAAAFIRSIAEERGRNADALEQTVLKAVSYTASEALDNDIVDLIARDTPDLLAKLHGEIVPLNGGGVLLETGGLAVREIRRTTLERFLGFLANPNVAFLLLTLGGIGILVEMLNPGLIAPGLVGAIALALVFVAVGDLPVNWVGVALIGLAMALFFFELQAPGIGIFGVGGAVSFGLGGILLFGGFGPPPIPSPSFRVSLWAIGAVSGVLFSFFLLFVRVVVQASMAQYTPVSEALVGRVGTVRTTLSPRGTVQVASELWSAFSDSGDQICEGEDVIVLGVQGLTLKVSSTSTCCE